MCVCVCEPIFISLEYIPRGRIAGSNGAVRASLVAQLVKNLPVMQKTWVQSLGWEDPLEKGTATHSRILENPVGYIVHGVSKSQTRLIDDHSLSYLIKVKDC